jgi:hypothetical protein
MVSPLNFAVEFSLPNPNDLDSMRSHLVLPKSLEEEDTFEDDGEMEYQDRLIRYKEKELELARLELAELKQARNRRGDTDDDDDDDEGSSSEEFEYRMDRDGDIDEDEDDRHRRNGRRGHR